MHLASLSNFLLRLDRKVFRRTEVIEQKNATQHKGEQTRSGHVILNSKIISNQKRSREAHRQTKTVLIYEEHNAQTYGEPKFDNDSPV